MKRITIDVDLCQGSRECAAIAPEVVTFDSAGVAQVNDDAATIDDNMAQRLVATCPSMAIAAEPAEEAP